MYPDQAAWEQSDWGPYACLWINLGKSHAVLSAVAFCDMQTVCIQIRLLGSSLIGVNTLACKLIYYSRKMWSRRLCWFIIEEESSKQTVLFELKGNNPCYNCSGIFEYYWNSCTLNINVYSWISTWIFIYCFVCISATANLWICICRIKQNTDLVYLQAVKLFHCNVMHSINWVYL